MSRQCRHGADCRTFDCGFAHPAGRRWPCRYGAACGKLSDLQHCRDFLHDPSLLGGGGTAGPRPASSTAALRRGRGRGRGHGRGQGQGRGQAVSSQGHRGERGAPSSRQTQTPRDKRAPVTECPICLERCEVIDVAGCGHTACTRCLRGHLTQGLQLLASYPLRCFAPRCSARVAERALSDRNLLRGHMEWRTFRRFSVLAAARDDGSQRAVHCPDCDQPQLVPAQAKGWLTRTCRNKQCSRGEYDVAPLENAPRSTFWLLYNVLSDGSREDGFKQCPQCHIIIIKEGGCRHVACACGHEFNWRSGKDWDSSTMPSVA